VSKLLIQQANFPMGGPLFQIQNRLQEKRHVCRGALNIRDRRLFALDEELTLSYCSIPHFWTITNPLTC